MFTIIEVIKSISRETPRYEHALWSPSCAISCACVYWFLDPI